MKLSTSWIKKMQFSVTDGNNTALMDAMPPIGDGTALTPKQLALAGAAGCAGVDVSAYMRKHKQELTAFKIEAEAPTAKTHPSVFTSIALKFLIEGQVSDSHAITAVTESMTLYCGVSAMLAKGCPIHYSVHVNGILVKEGKAAFPDSSPSHG